MPDLRDLELIFQSRIPLLVIETSEETRMLSLLERLSGRLKRGLCKWTVTRGLERMEPGYGPQRFNTEPIKVLQHIRSSGADLIYVLLDFHPYLNDPVHVRLVREIAQEFEHSGQTLVFLSPELEVPKEISSLAAKFHLSLPDQNRLLEIIREIGLEWTRAHPGHKVTADKRAIRMLARALSGLTVSDARRLAHKAVFSDGAITPSDVKKVAAAKYDLIDQKGVLAFEYETSSFADVGGLERLKNWLDTRRAVFHGLGREYGLETPKGLLLLGVQGCGKSLAAKAVAGAWHIPLLRLDFGTLYNKYIGETEKNLRDSLQTAETMAPCVLWIDEIEKGLGGDSGEDGGVSRRVLGTLLTWMAEKKRPVFIVATANDVTALPPELLRKGRFDEIFFVDLPDAETRALIFAIQLRRRNLDPADFDGKQLSDLAEGFSGAEIEQAVVSALYAALAKNQPCTQAHVEREIMQTRPLSVLMAEKIQNLRAWARERTVPAN